jgi:MFS family permease
MNTTRTPVLGNLSDRFGRRPVLLFALLALGIDYLIMGSAPVVSWLFVGRLVAGMTQVFGLFSSAAAPVYFPGAAFLAAAVLTIGSAVLFARAMRISPQQQNAPAQGAV